MEQSILTRHELNEAAIRHDAANGALINLANLGNGNDSLDLGNSSVDRLLVGAADLNLANTVLFVDSDGGTGVFLHLLDNLSTRTDDSTDELLGNFEGLDAWYLWLELGTWLGDGVGDALQDVLTTSLCLHEGFLEDVERQTIALDIHLGGCQTVLGTGGLEVHIAQVVLVAEDIGENSILVLARVLDKTHSNTADGLLHRNTGIHECQRTGTDSSH